MPEDFEIFRRDWSFSRFSRKPARRPRSNHQSNTFAMERETWINGCLVDRTIFSDLLGPRCRRTLKSVGTLKYFDEIGVFRDFLENQRDDRGRTIRVIRSQWDEKRGSMVVWSIGRFFGPSRRTVPEDFEIRRDFEIFRRDWSFSRFSRKPARRPRSNHQSNTFAMGRETWINGCLVDRTIFWTIPEDGAGGL